MDKIVECVPNFSTSDPQVIDAITYAIKSVPGVKLLDVDPDVDYNRTVVTFVGSPASIGKAAFAGIAKATELIDMTNHSGEHPRLGATDVCPFIPVRGVNFEDCISIAKELAEKIGSELEVPVYLYGKAATSEDRVKLSNIRKGEYEGLADKIKKEEWLPDFGPAMFKPKSGAYVTGVRNFLIAYNINLDTLDVDLANEIAGIVRESGRWVEKDGERVREPGLYKGIQAMGVTLERPNRKLTQVSMNVVNYQEQTDIHTIFEGVKKVAGERDVQVTGSEIVGLVPLDAILKAGKLYAPDVEDQKRLIDIAIKNLGLNDLYEFVPQRKIIELIINNQSLIELTVDRFLGQLSSDSATPGGGSVSALGGALATSLVTMVGNLTLGKEKFADIEEEISELVNKAIVLRNDLSILIDEDTEAFNEVMQAFKLPKDDTKRPEAIQNAMIRAAEVPLEVAKLSLRSFDLLYALAQKGNKNAITDVGTGAYFAEAAIRGALYNVRINLMSIKNEETKERLESEVKSIQDQITDKRDLVLTEVEKELSN